MLLVFLSGFQSCGMDRLRPYPATRSTSAPHAASFSSSAS